LDRAREEVSVMPSTVMVSVPVGVGVLEAEPEATVMVTTSSTPEAGEVVAAERVVVVAMSEDEDVGHAIIRL